MDVEFIGGKNGKLFSSVLEVLEEQKLAFPLFMYLKIIAVKKRWWKKLCTLWPLKLASYPLLI